jgi:hypothetical protein
MCNGILGNYMNKEDQLLTAAFGSRSKRRLNRVMHALNFEYPDYERLDEGIGGGKRKMVVSILGRQYPVCQGGPKGFEETEDSSGAE